MEPDARSRRFTFPRWANLLLPALLVLGLAPVYLGGLIGYAAGPRTTAVGYQPAQPMPFSHAKHVGELGMDCRYCHTTVEQAPYAAIPPAQTCWNCHNTTTGILRDSPRLTGLMQAHATGRPIPWVKVHDLADYAFFDHSRHVQAGVSCFECHGRVDRMDADLVTHRGVAQVHKLSMAWCLDCHRNPEARLRPKEEVFNLAWGKGLTAAQRKELGRTLRQRNDVNPSQDCWTCHR